MRSDSKLSVVIPTYGRQESLFKLLECLGQQTLPSIEVIVVDQNRGDVIFAKLLALQLSWVRHLRLPEPNVSRARNVGFHASRGAYVLFIDDDLAPTADFCARAVDTLERHSEVGCLCPVVYSKHEAEALLDLRRHYIGSELQGTNLREIDQTISAAIFFARSAYIQSGGFDELLFAYAGAAEDQELFLRMGKRGMSIWLDTTLAVFHDEDVPGGCELRTKTYWHTRTKCIKSWVFRHRIHGGHRGRLTLAALWQLTRSTCLNRGVLKQPPSTTLRSVGVLLSAIQQSRRYLHPHLWRYTTVNTINHLEYGSEGSQA